MFSQEQVQTLAREYLRVAERIKNEAEARGDTHTAAGAQVEIERWNRVLQQGDDTLDDGAPLAALTTYLVPYRPGHREETEMMVEAASARAARRLAHERLKADAPNEDAEVGQPRLAVPPRAYVGHVVQFGWGPRAVYGLVCEPEEPEHVRYWAVHPHDSLEHTMLRVFTVNGGPERRVRQLWRTGDGRLWQREVDPDMAEPEPGRQPRAMVTGVLGPAEDASHELHGGL